MYPALPFIPKDDGQPLNIVVSPLHPGQFIVQLYQGKTQQEWWKCRSNCLEHAEAEAEARYRGREGVDLLNGKPILQERDLNGELQY